jgi:excisionase family DNA binding protein
MQSQTSSTSPNQYLTVSQLAKHLQISESTIYGWVERNYIPYLMAGDLLRFDPNVINSWMSEEANRKREKKRQLHARVVK